MIKTLGILIGAAAAFVSVSAVAHPGHEHHALQSNAHFIAESLMAVGVVVVALLIARSIFRRNES